MAKKNLRDALLGNSKSAIDAGRSSVAGVGEASGAVWLPVADVAPDPDQPRRHYDQEAMRQLRESIASLGQIEPIVVQALGAAERDAFGGRRYRCISGHRRLRAHEALGLSEIKATVVRDRLSDADRFRHEIASNEVREDHTDFDRARFMTFVFSDALKVEGDEAARADRVKYLVNRAFNEQDRGGTLSREARATVTACEAALAALGERRNLRWYHRWGLPVLALRGSALEAAETGLDARRALAIARLGGRAGAPDSDARERVVARVARAAREHEVASREISETVKTIAAELDAGTLDDDRLEAILAALGERDAGGDTGTPSKTTGKPSNHHKAKPVQASLVDRARALSARWTISGVDHPRRAGKGSAQPLHALVGDAESADPRRAARLVSFLERADAELNVILERRERRNR